MSRAKKELIIKAPYGTFDILPEEIPIWERIESTAKRLFTRYGYQEIRTPIFENTSLFARSVGLETDIVQKQMYTIKTSDQQSLTLRPELSAPTVRAFIQHSLYKKKSFQKFWYLGPVLRHERPQKGRFREFHQLGVEALGSYNPLLDVETISLAAHLLKELGISAYTVNLNSTGCLSCRPRYKSALKHAVSVNLDKFCKDCQTRFNKNPLRILDCKNQVCKELTRALPVITEYLCDSCIGHFQKVKQSLESLGISFNITPTLVRGLDYYTRTVYEFTSPLLLGAPSSILGGGRYDNLIEELGGPALGAVGFAAGLERLIILLRSSRNIPNEPPIINCFVVYVDFLFFLFSFAVRYYSLLFFFIL